MSKEMPTHPLPIHVRDLPHRLHDVEVVQHPHQAHHRQPVADDEQYPRLLGSGDVSRQINRRRFVVGSFVQSVVTAPARHAAISPDVSGAAHPRTFFRTFANGKQSPRRLPADTRPRTLTDQARALAQTARDLSKTATAYDIAPAQAIRYLPHLLGTIR